MSHIKALVAVPKGSCIRDCIDELVKKSGLAMDDNGKPDHKIYGDGWYALSWEYRLDDYGISDPEDDRDSHRSPVILSTDEVLELHKVMPKERGGDDCGNVSMIPYLLAPDGSVFGVGPHEDELERTTPRPTKEEYNAWWKSVESDQDKDPGYLRYLAISKKLGPVWNQWNTVGFKKTIEQIAGSCKEDLAWLVLDINQ